MIDEPRLDYRAFGPMFEEALAHAQHQRQAALAQVHANLLQPPAPRRAWWWMVLVPAMAMAALLLGGWWWVATQRLHYTVDGHESPADVWISADHHDSMLAFSDGVAVVLHRGARARVTKTDRDDARILVESGTISFDGLHGETESWTLSAGPYVVPTSGARFELTWLPEREARLEVKVAEGTVVILGPTLEPVARIGAGEGLELVNDEVVHRGVVTARPDDGVEVAADPQAVPPDLEELDGDAARVSNRPRGSRETKPGAGTPSWREAADREDYGASFALVAPHLESLYETLGHADLMRLSDVARFSGHPDAATAALLRFRARFPRHRDVATAAFTLGHLSAARGDPASLGEAARWFALAVEERPQGPLHRSALSRLMQAYQRLGQTEQAREAAQTYLDRYPTGPHVELARRIVSP